MSVTSIVTTYSVTGMTCGHCAAAVSEEISQLPAVSAVDIDVASGRVAVTSGAEIDDAAVRAAVEEAGYTLAGRV
ncbi:copper chaperone [Frankia sp. EI5c]|uniref:heavy-metal-associated domain-containing protein n=1 Tax=Frankia sp. EI5c TaxID=683316 RepID=UPI0007C2B642|nr:heavy-metal-associated domain-containing protein [Frankia sp. EI5c]OAA26430.1 copper chaperone [Frankia sp. EI5c]